MNSITTLKVNCKDCHRCVRSCPVKAIGIQQGQARLIDDRCILCGRCVVECPQQAKQVQNQLSFIKDAIRDGKRVILSLAPSFVAAFADYTPESLFATLSKLGFTVVEETAIGAEVVSLFYKDLLNTEEKTIISACCPVVVGLIEKYYPSLVPNLAPVVSPMVAHGKLIKARYGEEAVVVFAGPCVAKITEREKHQAHVDAVITFEQLRTWLKDEQPTLSDSKAVEGAKPCGNGRFYPIAGGVLKSFMNREDIDTEVVTVDGIEQCMELFEALVQGEIKPRFIEALACAGGCVGGPAVGLKRSLASKRVNVINYAKQEDGKMELPGDIEFSRTHAPAPPSARSVPTESVIREIMYQTGKFSKSDEKNCGACGYSSCREQALAVHYGLAEVDMCVPYMRSKAESFANIIVANSLNAIIVVDHRMLIQHFNPAAERMFNRNGEIIKGTSLAAVMDCAQFVEAAVSGAKVVGKRVEYPTYGLITEQMIIPVPEHNVIIGIITDVTSQEAKSRELELLKLETIRKATQIIDKQMHVAQEIAGLLGETTAETKGALLEVIWLLKGKGET